MHTDTGKDIPKITVRRLIEESKDDLDLSVLAGNDGLENAITSSRIQKLGLALAGFAHHVHNGRIQIVGQSEVSYLNQLSSEQRIDSIRNLEIDEVCCILITKGLQPPKELLDIGEEEDLPILSTPMVSSGAISVATKFLLEALAPHITQHGVFVGMYGIGVLMLGDSGIGKSECALDLITRGHRLIADDAVLIKKIGDRIEGESPELIYELIEIRGLGILNVRELFGVSAVGRRKEIELLIELKRWDEVADVERVGLESQEEEIFDVKINKFVLPVNVGRNLSTLIETAVRLYLLKSEGYNAAQKLFKKHSELVKGN